ncbi:MAG: hypothetical protein ACYCQJ_05195 [Nitrososphaerales archaeon]
MSEQQQEPKADNRNKILAWALQNTAESRSCEYKYVWPQAVEELEKTLEVAHGGLFVLGGLSGSGKSTALIQLKKKLEEKIESESVVLFKWMGFKRLDEIAEFFFGRDAFEDILDGKLRGDDLCERKIREQKEIKEDSVISYLAGANTVLIDTRDYSITDRRQLTGDLDGIQRLWQTVINYRRQIQEQISEQISEREKAIPNFVVCVQSEIAISDKGQLVHFFLKKARTFNIGRFSHKELMEAYVAEFGSRDPFDEEGLTVLAIQSHGIFRRFLKYIAICLENTEPQTKITGEIVNSLVDSTQLEHDMTEELSAVFRSENQRMMAVWILMRIESRQTIGIQDLVNDGMIDIFQKAGYLEQAPNWYSGEQKRQAYEKQVDRVIQRLATHGYIQNNQGLITLNEA